MRIVSDRESKLFQSSRMDYPKLWIFTRTAVLLITHRPMDNRESKLDCRCYAKSLCSAVRKKLE
jgi:hypothetical protein